MLNPAVYDPAYLVYLSIDILHKSFPCPCPCPCPCSKEVAGEYAVDEKARFYRIAKRSATECAGFRCVSTVATYRKESIHKGARIIDWHVSMLIKMVQKHR